ncbi:SUCROSE EXPORT DEFECTIVE 1, VITAMIN E DEFICIENT 1 [Hibiscus trionum]|uniref:SUCROSE EXPORT DEFECTIVE 1, VITAMIN E DEFICIENT 1 n=1 Tax=Hibiscus trionum TaxID=183268 RepID=A0A9W7I5C4_HIBTR|nr:SUCROSE EXPORT DEFECTIVE 1, VITAMIN E DEFICIENT 1 [Hibiscus trionum]
MDPNSCLINELHRFSPCYVGLRSLNSKSAVKVSQSSTSNAFSPRRLRPLSRAGFGSNSFVACSSVSETETKTTSPAAKRPVPVKPVYVPTPANRGTRTPHSGYHFDGTSRQFFEGWYFKVSIPERKQSFCFMYSVENPAFRKKLTPLETLQHGPRFTGVGAQILGAYDKYICQYTEESQNFWGRRHELILGNTFVANKASQPPSKEVPPQEFNRKVLEGFQVTPLWSQGFIRDDGRTYYAETVKTASWEYSTRPIYGWGDVGSKQKSTAGWLAAFPIFEPHWQICMASGLSTGWIEWDGERFEFQDAPSYSEKNWGAGFPRKWFWAQCNVFEGARGEITLTAAGGLRQLPGLTETFENAALIGVHYDGIFYEFVPWNGVLTWEIAQWGYWNIAAENTTHMVEIEATTTDSGTTLRAPTVEAGLAPACKDTCSGDLTLKIWEKTAGGSKGKLILDVKSDMAALEVGGGPWFNTWKGKTTTPEVIKSALEVPVDMEGLFGLAPFLKPPGL